jgi:hypothetical protein
MALLTSYYPTLIDLSKRMDPDGKFPDIAALLNLSNPVLNDMPWFEGNLPTGERTTVRTGLPTAAFRALNEGVPRSKSTTAQVDEGAAMLEAFSQVDRALAIMSPGGPGQFRLDEASTFLESMSQTLATTIFYGNSALNKRTFTGLAPRYGAKGLTTGKNIVDAGGTGSNNASIWFAMWGKQTVRGIYPKGTKGGFTHEDVTYNKEVGSDGFAIGDRIRDGNGNDYMGFTDHFKWNCGLALKDWRYVARVANIDRAALVSGSGAADVTRAMIAAYHKIPNIGAGVSMVDTPTESSYKAAIYMDRTVQTALDLQVYQKATNTLFDWKNFDTGAVMTFRGVPIRTVDALAVAEARVV